MSYFYILGLFDKTEKHNGWMEKWIMSWQKMTSTLSTSKFTDIYFNPKTQCNV